MVAWSKCKNSSYHSKPAVWRKKPETRPSTAAAAKPDTLEETVKRFCAAGGCGNLHFRDIISASPKTRSLLSDVWRDTSLHMFRVMPGKIRKGNKQNIMLLSVITFPLKMFFSRPRNNLGNWGEAGSGVVCWKCWAGACSAEFCWLVTNHPAFHTKPAEH